MHKPIRFQDLGLHFPHKTCFSNFSAQITYGSRIAIIGRNGQGKSTLLKILQGAYLSYDGDLFLPDDLCIGYLPQLIDPVDTLSGGEGLNKALTDALYNGPNLLLLDEPTNHLDKSNRRSLMNHLRHYPGTLVIVTHDLELINNCIDTLWHIQNGEINIFNGDYETYQRIEQEKKLAIQHELSILKRQKKDAHKALMKEQERGKHMRIRGEKSIENRKWPTIRSHTKLGQAIQTGDKRLNHIKVKQQEYMDEMSTLYNPEVIEYHFQLNANVHQKLGLTVKNGSVSYERGPLVLSHIDFHMRPAERVAIYGDNGSGKSTFVKALLGAKDIIKDGEWVLPEPKKIGYLDQHYKTLDPRKTVFDRIQDEMPNHSNIQIRQHLNDFLFRKNEEIEMRIGDLSGGEKARLSLCCIAASPPMLLILDEMTNNLDLETRAHVIQILKNCPVAMIVISHDQDFLDRIQINTSYLLHDGVIQWIK